MRDDRMGGFLAFVIAAPIMVVCCGGGGALVAALLGGLGGWLTGLGGIATVLAAVGGYLFWREIRRGRAKRAAGDEDAAACCTPDGAHKVARPDPADAR